MDKHTQAEFVWGLFLFFWLLAFWSNCKSWADGEVKRSSPNSFKFRTIRREENPESFQRYMTGMFIIIGFFFLVIIIWGIALFFW